MVNFEKLVESVLLLEAGDSKPIQNFIQDNAELVELKRNLNKFGITPSMLAALPSSWYRSLDERILLRFTVSAISSSEYINVFPYVDFLALVKQYFDVKFINPIEKGSLEVVELTFNDGDPSLSVSDFDSRKNGPGNHPFFNYVPCSALLKSEYPRIKQEIVNSNIIGKMVIQNLQNVSVKKAIYTVVNMAQPTPKSNVPENDEKINKFLMSPSNYLPGQSNVQPLPPEVKNVGAKFFNLANVLNQLVDVSSPTESVLNFINTKTIANVKAEGTDEAKDFIELLEQLANIIPKTPTKQWSDTLTRVMGGIGQIGQGLKSLGGPTMGR
jgi:hypothetical protein